MLQLDTIKAGLEVARTEIAYKDTRLREKEIEFQTLFYSLKELAIKSK